KRPARSPPSTFLFLPIHLSNSPGPGSPFPGKPEKRSKLHASDLQSEALSLSSVWSFEGAPSRRSSGRCAVQPVYRLSGPLLSTLAAVKKYRLHPRVQRKIYRICSRAHQPRGHVRRATDAPLGPHSSAVLTGKAGGVNSGELYVGITIGVRAGIHPISGAKCD